MGSDHDGIIIEFNISSCNVNVNRFFIEKSKFYLGGNKM